jgi:N-acetyl-anhydromuramyl-L-alanine amidase AmpD
VSKRVAVAVVAGVVAACRGAPVQPPCPEPRTAPPTFAALIDTPVDSPPSAFDEAFAAAGREFAVPSALLKAIAWVETRWQMVQGTEEFPGQRPAFGVMALRGERLERGAALGGMTVDSAARDPAANVRAAAALLDAYAREAGIDRSRPGEWAEVVARFSGIEAAEARAAYAREVGRALESGFRRAAAVSGCPEPPPGGADYAPSVWRSSPNFDQRAADSTGVPHTVIIHTCESNYTSCWSWLVNPVSQVSAHYVVDEDGTEISQLVREPDRAWHIAALYDCTLNRRHDCWLNDVQSNHFTVGIEHAGFASQDSFPETQIDASAALVCDITRDRSIPRDWQHVVGHGQLQPNNKTDPGPTWPWVRYLHRIQRHCGEIVVDDEATLNDPEAATVAVPAGWVASDSTSDYYGAGYRWAPTRADAVDFVAFSFRVDELGPRTVEVRWTSGSNRSPRAAYAVIDAAGDTLGTGALDQTQGGGGWHTLGTWSFAAGWNRVVLLRRDVPGFVVVADAVRARRPRM